MTQCQTCGMVNPGPEHRTYEPALCSDKDETLKRKGAVWLRGDDEPLYISISPDEFFDHIKQFTMGRIPDFVRLPQEDGHSCVIRMADIVTVTVARV